MMRNASPAAWLLRLAIIGAAVLLVWHYWPAAKVESVQSADGSRIKFRTQDDRIEIYENNGWTPFFVKGVNVGAALPGHDPGELPIPKETYLDWFKQIQALGANTIRVYTILSPAFYQALVEYNERAEHPLYFIQGVWTPEDELIEKKDAYLSEIYTEFQTEIEHAVGAVYGAADIPQRFGKASGAYRANAGPYLLAWHIGTEWDPRMVQNTNDTHKDKIGFTGSYVSAKAQASPFENWLAEMLDHVAVLETQYGWKHPLTFTNWVTTDPLEHPGEILITEDMVGVDAMHLAVNGWPAGYFASYHAYPYYPDFFRLDAALYDVKEADGTPNTYRSYLRKLKEHHQGIPVMITEFGVPSSLGVAHLTGMNRNQGGHDEAEQGRINASLLGDIYNEGMAGGIVFSWQDEWFKRTWNTMHFEIPQNRRKLWHNVLTNEQHFGLVAMLSGKDGLLKIDGDDSDWQSLKPEDKQQVKGTYPGWKSLTMTHDEAYVYLTGELERPFDPDREKLYFGVDVTPGGNKHGDALGGRTLDEGLETLIVLGKDDESEVQIAANYDFHTRLYGKQYGMIPPKPEDEKDDSGVFHPWKLAVGLEMIPPDTKKYSPFEDVPAGKLLRGTTDPASKAFNSLAMWQAKGSKIELRVPWMLLGFTDPSSLQVMAYGEKDGKLYAVPSQGIRLVPWIAQRSDGSVQGLDGGNGGAYPVASLPLYSWPAWEQSAYTERLKQSYPLMQEAFRQIGSGNNSSATKKPS
ncbi:hypothetical protein PAESOLCIP111_04210 [Paenibacillus solanacearum]|uniref:Family 2 glycosyl transferase n=1 Tax=Paenibacillus solanacearum TaxID=2048548 RepID=A0A916NY85_9BACL|nr:hypothetical protein [Paenibacillus solanacearum]CAG7641140.1 hypothetical protein PAESOLCIP111_04210 [Paenibacillus solanacearum]